MGEALTEDEDEEENQVDEDLPQSRSDHDLPLLSHGHVRRVPQTWSNDILFKNCPKRDIFLAILTGNKVGERDPASCRAVLLGGRVSVKFLLELFAESNPCITEQVQLL